VFNIWPLGSQSDENPFQPFLLEGRVAAVTPIATLKEKYLDPFSSANPETLTTLW
jgi:hypothetical protein